MLREYRRRERTRAQLAVAAIEYVHVLREYRHRERTCGKYTGIGARTVVRAGSRVVRRLVD